MTAKTNPTTIKLTFSTIDRYRETRTFKTLKGARAYAHKKVGSHPDISWAFRYAVGSWGDAKLEICEGTTFADLFPTEEQLESEANEAVQRTTCAACGGPVGAEHYEGCRGDGRKGDCGPQGFRLQPEDTDYDA